MVKWGIVTSPIGFRDALFAQTSESSVDTTRGAVLRVLLYYVWRGAFEFRAAVIQEHIQGDLGLLCLSTYKAFLPIVQMIRMGYPADALILLRALMERIALVGYLDKNRNQIPQYAAGTSKLQERAMAWAKEHAPENWMRLYSSLSNVAHSRMEGPAAHLLDETEIGRAFRENLSKTPEAGAQMTDVLLGLVCYALLALDPIAVQLVRCKRLSPFPMEEGIITYLTMSDVVEFRRFLLQLAEVRES